MNNICSQCFDLGRVVSLYHSPSPDSNRGRILVLVFVPSVRLCLEDILDIRNGFHLIIIYVPVTVRIIVGTITTPWRNRPRGCSLIIICISVGIQLLLPWSSNRRVIFVITICPIVSFVVGYDGSGIGIAG
jgi:hypothetical protein